MESVNVHLTALQKVTDVLLCRAGDHRVGKPTPRHPEGIAAKPKRLLKHVLGEEGLAELRSRRALKQPVKYRVGLAGDTAALVRPAARLPRLSGALRRLGTERAAVEHSIPLGGEGVRGRVRPRNEV